MPNQTPLSKHTDIVIAFWVNTKQLNITIYNWLIYMTYYKVPSISTHKFCKCIWTHVCANLVRVYSRMRIWYGCGGVKVARHGPMPIIIITTANSNWWWR